MINTTSLSKSASGVAALYNELTLKDFQPIVSAAKEAAPESHIVSDTGSLAKATSARMYAGDVEESESSEPSTNNGVGTLSGKLDSGSKRALALELAENILCVPGVKSESLIC